MYIIAERLRRPMRRQYGGKWISMSGYTSIYFYIYAIDAGYDVYSSCTGSKKKKKDGK